MALAAMAASPRRLESAIVEPERSLLELPLGEVLERVSARTPGPGGGSVAAIATALAAGLTLMAVGFSSDDWEARANLAARAASLRRRAEQLADEDADAYARYLETREVERIVATPLAVAAAAAEVAELAARAASEGNPRLTADAAAGAVLAAAAARVAASLVRVNLADREDARVGATNGLARRAAEAAARALAAGATR